MNAIDKIYTPYNFSTTRCHVVALTVKTPAYMKIEYKLPEYVKKIKGIFISVSCIGNKNVNAGFIFLSFNQQVLKSIQLPIVSTILLEDTSHPLAFDEIIKSNSFIQGFYYDATNNSVGFRQYTLSIYLHYEP